MKKRIKKWGAAAICCSLIILMTGCWDVEELDAISIVTGVGLDASEQPGQLDLSFQVAMVNNAATQEDSSSNGSFITLEATDRFVLGGIDSLRYSNSRKLFMHHNQVIIFGNDLARKGVKPYLDMFMRNTETRMEVWILVAKNDAKSILTTETKQEKLSAMALAQMIRNERQISPYTSSNMLHFTSRLVDRSTAPVALVVEPKEIDGLTSLTFSGMAVFKDDVLVSIMDASLMQGFILGMGTVNGGNLELASDLGNANLKVNKSLCERKIEMDEEGNVTVKMNIDTELAISELHGFRSMDIIKVTEFLQKEAKKDLETKVRSSFAESQRLKADIYGIGAHIHKHHPKEWEKMEYAWSELYPTVTLEVTMNVNISSRGKISESLIMKEGHK
ncbi:Ger(x)C family spore germination protein [Clostridium minihomine]|uniref:Ger(x)C family spore germination protein n=1 Tax=Clostridium minihomine TaxID=2045012 RepID=UPI000C781A59|nr:Ger(x)C family spore germination protein [Clostridium minihomine]